MKIVALTGRKRSGKDTACAVVKAAYPNVQHISFAAPLKEMVSNMYGRAPYNVPARCFYVDKEEPIDALNGQTGRDVLKAVGGAFRAIDPDYWAKIGMAAIAPEASMVVISDCRYLNEARAIQALGGYVVRLWRNHDASTDTHQSEIEMDQIQYDAQIDNRLMSKGECAQAVAEIVSAYLRDQR